MKRPQITLLILFTLEFIVAWYMHGKEKLDKEWNPKKYSMWDTLIGIIIMLFLLYMWWFFI